MTEQCCPNCLARIRELENARNWLGATLEQQGQRLLDLHRELRALRARLAMR